MAQQTFSGVPGDFTAGQVLTAADMDLLREWMLYLIKDGTETDTGAVSPLIMDLDAGNVALVPASAMGYRNTIQNGNMQVVQRAATYTVGAGSGTRYYPADRWFCEDYTWSAGSDVTFSRDATVYPTGHLQSFKVASGGTGLTFAAGGYMGITHCIEGINIAPYYGETEMTLSFWCRSTDTGVFNVLFANGWWGAGAADRGLTKEFTISAANTWEYKTITFDLAAGTASGTWQTGSGLGLLLQWELGANANRTGDHFLDSWAAWSAYEVCTDSNIQMMTGANSNFYLTGVQLEVGSNATPFEQMEFGEQLARCQRYYFRNYPGTNYGTSCWGIANATTSVVTIMELPVTMRTGASAIDYSNQVTTNFGATNEAGALTRTSWQSPNKVQMDAGAASGTPFTVGYPYGVRNNNNAAGYIGATAEFLP
jgi:hypothetical protein